MNFFKVGFFCLFLALASAEGGYRLVVRNGGGYVARFDVSYTLDGQRHSISSGKFILGEKRHIIIPDRAADIYMRVQEYWFISSLTTIFTKYFPSAEQHCYEIWGTTMGPSWDEADCSRYGIRPRLG